jgi:hypothetical protein
MDLKRIVLYGTLAAHAGVALARELSVIALFRDRALVEIDGRERLLAAGTGSPEGILLVSADSNEAVIEIDGRRQIYAAPPGSNPPGPRRPYGSGPIPPECMPRRAA